ncbi:hypothetical protein PGTUg99_034746 [Puccinia graminis f. sp. tritici]|uniref:RING-type E3 ubiquitin transferase n=1 Tax=Puccinia graminis f. sp. tritici TaxID=56615 RepID=A0A5B0SL94_PUCGR|nr:hypothetical protein PGTUg99_034746 [Puccinia graminis f. sp. tritici]
MKLPRLTSLFFSSAFLILLLLKISQEAVIPSRRVELVSQYDCKENGLAPAGIGKASVSSEEKICVVCQEDLQSAKDNLKQPIGALDGCGHSFHRACADQWLVASGTCPTCRHEYKLEYKLNTDKFVETCVKRAAFVPNSCFPGCCDLCSRITMSHYHGMCRDER